MPFAGSRPEHAPPQVPAAAGDPVFRFPFRIADWEAFAGPSLADKQAWKVWAAGVRGDWSAAETPLAPVSRMAPILRRRADAADRLALEVAFRLAPAGGLPTVFASRHGQVVRSAAMLRAQAAGEPPSPMDFSLSVHNATAGQYAIAAGDRHSGTSLSARGESFGSGLLEAAGLMAEGAPEVLLVASDPCLPGVLEPLGDGEPAGYAVALLLRAEGGEAFACALGPSAAPDDSRPQALAFLRALAAGDASASWSRGGRLWSWERL